MKQEKQAFEISEINVVLTLSTRPKLYAFIMFLFQETYKHDAANVSSIDSYGTLNMDQGWIKSCLQKYIILTHALGDEDQKSLNRLFSSSILNNLLFDSFLSDYHAMTPYSLIKSRIDPDPLLPIIEQIWNLRIEKDRFPFSIQELSNLLISQQKEGENSLKPLENVLSQALHKRLLICKKKK